MVKVTATAFSRLKRKLRRQPEGIAVRITLKNGHVEFRPDKEQTGDVVFAHRGQSVLLVGTDTADKIARKTLDVVKTADGDRLRFTRPV
ncbi:MAG: hypothetical protein U0936_00855 [Planctomycetaceae bacterium]